GVPFGDPEIALAVRPYAARALIGRRRLYDRGFPRLAIDPGQMAAGKRDIIDFAGRRGGDAIWTATLGILPHLDLAALPIEPSVNAILAGEPEVSVAVERCGVQIGVASVLGQFPELDLPGLGIITDNRILAAI